MQLEETVKYENVVLRNGIRTNEIMTTIDEDKKCHTDNRILSNRINILIYVMFAMLIVLYVAFIVAIGLFAVYTPKAQADGNWAKWSEWTPCHVTCGNESKSRFRTCTNPPPTINGEFCVGNITEIAICHLPKCPGQRSIMKRHHVSFSARLADLAQTVNQNDVIVFNDVINNIMNKYDSNTGIFNAPLSGVYLFIYFIEINGAYGKVELKLNNKSISTTTLYGMFIDFEVSGFNHNITFESTKIGGTETVFFDNLNCLGERLSVGGYNKTVIIKPTAPDRCPCKDGVKASGGNSVVIHVYAGDQVWIQYSERRRISVRPNGTTFTGILLTEE